MKKNVKQIIIAMFGMLFIAGCGSKQDAMTTPTKGANNEFNVEEQSTSETERQLIIDYYDALYDLNKDVKENPDRSLTDTVKKYKQPIEAFINYEVPQDSEYYDYFEDIHANKFAKDLVTYFTDRHEEKSLDDEILKLSYQYMIDWYTDDLMDIQIPFSYEKQVERTDITTEKANFAKVSNMFASYVNQQIKTGRNVYQHTYSMANAAVYEYPETSKYSTSIGEIGFSPFIFINVDKNNCEMGFYLDAKKS